EHVGVGFSLYLNNSLETLGGFGALKEIESSFALDNNPTTQESGGFRGIDECWGVGIPLQRCAGKPGRFSFPSKRGQFVHSLQRCAPDSRRFWCSVGGQGRPRYLSQFST